MGDRVGRFEERDRIGDVSTTLRMAPRLFYHWTVSFYRIVTLPLKHWLSIAGVIAVGGLHSLVIKTARVHSG